MSLPVLLVHEFCELSDYLWSACTDMAVDVAQEMLLCVDEEAEDLIDRFSDFKCAPGCGELLGSWQDLYSWAATYITSSDRIDECLWLNGTAAPTKELPLELAQAFARHRCAIAALHAPPAE